MDINWINNIVNDLTNPDYRLSNTILKVKVLALKSNNEKLKSWVQNEINGYKDLDVPDYRVIKVGIYGNMVQDRGFGEFQTRQEFPLSIYHLSEEIQESLRTAKIKGSIADLEEMVIAKGEYSIVVPPMLYSELSAAFKNDWKIETAWQSIPKNIIQGIIVKIKSKLIDFLVEISEVIGQGENISILKDQPNVDNIFDKTIGQIIGDTVNISVGTENIQSINSGEYSSSNVAIGNNINQSITQDIKTDVKDFMVWDLASDIPERIKDLRG
ncbi:hypothetical protein LCGC14_2422920, partial [marine sediment metagenome]